VFLLLLLFFKNRFYRKTYWLSLIVFFFTYCFIVTGAFLSDIQLQENLAKFDLNNDGIFSGKEINLKQKKALNKLTNDTARKLSYLTGFIYAIIISTFIFIVGILSRVLK